ncbi:lysophospholipid acyltransferase family protein [Streptomyces sp. ODS28]|uniref:lysophospholipid acyltransferase family protein n=1 Tax=Streptomyces sp. ODS28 TaxID=3136688 RepID=UPI0031EA164B
MSSVAGFAESGEFGEFSDFAEFHVASLVSPSSVPDSSTAESGRANPWKPTSPCTPLRCLPPRGSGRAAGPARRALRWSALCGVLVAGIAFSPAARGRAAVVRGWARALVRATGVRVRINELVASGGCGRAPAGGRGCAPRPALLVANHVSWLDIPLLAAVRPVRMVAKSDVAAYPVLGRLATYGGTVFIDRERLRQLPATVAEVAALLRAGRSVAVFPEGSTRCGRAEGAFRNALFQAALDAGAEVRPVTLRYRTSAGLPTARPAFVGEDTLLTSLRRVIAARDLYAEVTVHPPLNPANHGTRRALARAARAAVTGVREEEQPDTWGVRSAAQPGEGPEERPGLMGVSGNLCAGQIRSPSCPKPTPPAGRTPQRPLPPPKTPQPPRTSTTPRRATPTPPGMSGTTRDQPRTTPSAPPPLPSPPQTTPTAP